jgi:hypothetical protein
VADCCLIKLKLSPISSLVAGSKVFTTLGLVLYQSLLPTRPFANPLLGFQSFVDSGKGFRTPICYVASTLVRSRLSSFIGSEPGVALDPVGSISLAYC